MAQLLIENIVFSARVSPKRYESKPMSQEEAFKTMIDKVKDLQIEQGWEIYDIFETYNSKGFRLKITAKDECEYYTEVYISK